MSENTQNNTVSNVIKGTKVKIPFNRLLSQTKSGDLSIAISNSQSIFVKAEKLVAAEGASVIATLEDGYNHGVSLIETRKPTGMKLSSKQVVDMLVSEGCEVVGTTERPRIDFTKFSK